MRHATRYWFRQIRGVGSLTIFAGVTLSLIYAAVGQSQAPTLERPPTRSVGDTFTYHDTDNKYGVVTVVLTYIGQKDGLNCYSEKATNAQQSETCFASDGNLVRRSGTWKPAGFTPNYGLLSFPLFVGKQWHVSYELTAPAGVHQDYRMHTIAAKVVSYEKVTVPAGTFDTFKIQARDAGWGEHGGQNITAYYSPELGMIKNDEESSGDQFDHLELIGYGHAKPGA
jgi:hypothetical protein